MNPTHHRKIWDSSFYSNTEHFILALKPDPFWLSACCAFQFPPRTQLAGGYLQHPSWLSSPCPSGTAPKGLSWTSEPAQPRHPTPLPPSTLPQPCVQPLTWKEKQMKNNSQQPQNTPKPSLFLFVPCWGRIEGAGLVASSDTGCFLTGLSSPCCSPSRPSSSARLHTKCGRHQ